MNREEFRKKIVDIIFITGQGNDYYTDGERFIVDEKMANELADALIAAGICDAIEYKDKQQSCAHLIVDLITGCAECKLPQCIGCKHDCTLAQEVEKLLLSEEDKRQERDELEVKCEVLQRDVDNLTRTLEEGREELEEVKHRAEVVEVALRHQFKNKRGWWFIDVSCDIARCRDIGCGSGRCIDILVDNAIKRAEKELAEGKKNE